MKNIIILILLGIIAYLVYTSGILTRAVQSVPQLVSGTPNPNETPHISVTVYSPYGTGIKTSGSNSTPTPVAQAPVVTIVSQPTAVPDVPIFVPPTPIVVMPAVPPTLALPNTPTPSASFQIALDAPHDGESVNTSPLRVTGRTAPNAIVSVNDVVGVATGEGRFDLQVPLQAGPNVLEIIASEPNGQQTFVIVTVMYQP
ncbi:MAG TPA: hypothetical protein VMP08_07505 [Anaerolineae bacterium]|nr:hypothetical protein [Anaerolineae bacterium]